MIGTVSEPLPLLPLADPGQVSERADAARNRARIMEAAVELVRLRGIEHVSMDDVAAAAQVGTGTVYRRFGDRAGLALALLDEQTRAFQDALLAGPPPLGPGAPAVERLRAFGCAYLDLLDAHADLIMAGSPGGREGEGPARMYLTHLAFLVREAVPDLDAEFTAHALLASLSPGHHVHARRRLGWTLDRLHDGWSAMVDALSASAGRARA